MSHDATYDNAKPKVNRQRPHGVFVRLTDEELARLNQDCDRSGLSRAGVLRATWQGSPGPRSRREPPAGIDVLKQLLGQTGKLGGNVNQIAHKANEDNAVATASIQRTESYVAEIRTAVLKALGLKP